MLPQSKPSLVLLKKALNRPPHCIRKCYKLHACTLTLVDVNDQNHHVNDVHASDDGANQRRMTGAVDERELKRIVWQPDQVRRHGHLQTTDALM